jgi:hypothetical protein
MKEADPVGNTQNRQLRRTESRLVVAISVGDGSLLESHVDAIASAMWELDLDEAIFKKSH